MLKRYAALFILAGSAVEAEAQQHRAVDRDLISAGFVARLADTHEKMERLKALPPYRFLARTTNGARYYIYADPNDCKCAFVGYQKAYDAYRDMMLPPAPPPGMQEFARTQPRPGADADHLVIQDMDDDAGLEGTWSMFHRSFD